MDRTEKVEMRTAVGGETLGGASRGNQKLTKTLKTSPVGGAASKRVAEKGDVVFRASLHA